jgi:mitogen-activated protein kinase 6
LNHRSAFDKIHKKNVAIKKVTRVFDDPIDAKRILREIKLMKKFQHENVRGKYSYFSSLEYLE